MTADEATQIINETLNIDGRITVRGDEIKCVLRDEDGGLDKAYLSSADCTRLAIAFSALAPLLVQGQEPKP